MQRKNSHPKNYSKDHYGVVANFFCLPRRFHLYRCFLVMFRSCHRVAPILIDSLPEQLVKEVQSSPRFTQTLESRLIKNLPRFSPRHCALILNGLTRTTSSEIPTRRLVHLVSQKLMSSMRDLTLRDLALVIHGMSKLGLRNEIFISESLEAVQRKLRTTPQHSNKTVSAAALICRSIVKLNLAGDGSLLNEVKTLYLPRWFDEGIVNEIDAITLFPIFEDVEILQKFASIIESVELRSSAVFSCAKRGITEIVPNEWWAGIDAQFPTLPLAKQVQALYGLSVLNSRYDKQVISRWFLILQPHLLTNFSNNKQLVFLTITAITRLAEILPQYEMVSFMENVVNCLDDSVNAKEISIILNCMAGIRLEVPGSFRHRIDSRLTDPRGQLNHLDSHSFPIIVSSLIQLGENELCGKILHVFFASRDRLVRGLTNQGTDLLLMSIASLWDLNRSDTTLHDWIELLLRSKISNENSSESCAESSSQIRIVQSILGICLQGTSTPAAQSPNIVSVFHSQVAETMRSLGKVPGETKKIELNAVDNFTGYEIDIRICD